MWILWDFFRYFMQNIIFFIKNLINVCISNIYLLEVHIIRLFLHMYFENTKIHIFDQSFIAYMNDF